VSSTTRQGVAVRYDAMVVAGTLVDDRSHRAAAVHFDRVAAALNRPVSARDRLRRLLGRVASPVRGLYIHGDVGRGKTMLMDMFHQSVDIGRKRRVHFNEFMGDVHERVHAIRSERRGERDRSDPIIRVAEMIAAETRLLCLDEFAVTDIADAMILSRLFTVLFRRGLVLVATSNSAPDDLYAGGLNRDLFMPFVELLKRANTVVRFDDGSDYRLQKLAGGPIYLTPADKQATSRLDDVWADLTRGETGEPATIRFKGRDIMVPRAAGGAARFDFADLLERPLGANDFVVLARTYHTIFIDHIPVINAQRRDVAHRFILLIDTLYDHRVKLVASAAAAPSGLYAPSGEVGRAFRRTVSRLTEMQSLSYLGASHGGRATGGVEGDEALAPILQSG
jgi:cell division protein ZapE